MLASLLEQRGSAHHMENASGDQIFPEVTQRALGSGLWLLTSAVSGVTLHLTTCQAPMHEDEGLDLLCTQRPIYSNGVPFPFPP